MKKWWISLFIMLLFILNVNAYSKEKSADWLVNNADWSNGLIEDNSFALLAIKTNNYNPGNGYDIMLQRKDPANCYPVGNCNVKDTALATLALKQFNYDTNPLLAWLNSALTRASVTNWYLQIKTDKSGECTITYDQDKTKKAIVNGTQKLTMDNKKLDWISIENDLQANLDQPVENIKVDCSQVNDAAMIISLLRIVQNTDFYIIQESQSSISNLVINNACYPQYLGGQCDEEASFYAAYSLKKLNEEVKVAPYLLDKADNNLENAMLYTITNDQKYLINLIQAQNSVGYWDNENIYTTSFAINALKNTQYRDQFGNATSWLKSKQITSDLVNNGSFGSVLNTGVALYLALGDSFSGVTPSTCGNNLIEIGESCDDGNLVSGDGCSSSCILEATQECILDSDCLLDQVCSNGVCVSSGCSSDLDCPADQACDVFTKQCKSRTTGECGDGFCSINEDSTSCPIDCEEESESQCGDNVCSTDEDETSCPIDCSPVEEKSNTLFWASLIIIIIILGVGGYFGYTKFFKKKGPSNKGGPSYFMGEEPKKQVKESYTPQSRSSRRTDIDESLERELDKSIKETQKLLKK